MSLLIPDVSEFQAPSNGNAPNWAGIKAQNGGAAIIRVGYGNAHLDHMFVSNYTDLKANGFDFIGLYHYLRADQDVISQAVAFCNWVGPVSSLAPGSIPMLDLEEGSGNQSGRADQWFAIVDAHFGLDKLSLDKRSWIYSGNSFANTQGLAPIFNSARHSWVASYKATETGLLPHTLWQSTDGRVGANRTNWSGCGFVDTSITSHSLSDLAAMAYQPGVPDNNNPNPPINEDDMPAYGSVPSDGTPVVVSWLGGTISQVVFLAPRWDLYADAPASLTVEVTVNHSGSAPFVTRVDVPKADGHYTATYAFGSKGDVNGVVLRLVGFPVDSPIGYHLNP